MGGSEHSLRMLISCRNPNLKNAVSVPSSLLKKRSLSTGQRERAAGWVNPAISAAAITETAIATTAVSASSIA
ncbi:MAG: hypothetical protein MH252_17675 [Thermosynechococcaceae cyanobacterium MS004]|nr:hypothetical protein [Thermosynechococcaceae cyanobacterium MS004]